MLRQDGPLRTPLSSFTTLTLIRLQVLRSCLFEPTVCCWFIIGPDRQRFSAWRVWYIVPDVLNAALSSPIQRTRVTRVTRDVFRPQNAVVVKIKFSIFHSKRCLNKPLKEVLKIILKLFSVTGYFFNYKHISFPVKLLFFKYYLSFENGWPLYLTEANFIAFYVSNFNSKIFSHFLQCLTSWLEMTKKYSAIWSQFFVCDLTFYV